MATHRRSDRDRKDRKYDLFGGFKYAYRGGDRRKTRRDDRGRDRDDRKKRGGKKYSKRKY
jgi:hypothetical protein